VDDCQSWTIARISEEDRSRIRGGLRREVEAWLVALARPTQLAGMELNGVIASVAHLAYHLGAIRQIHAGLRGPKDTGA
jgi:hypothetical protein